ncbi:methylated-DNA--[protein]-cysteine S-methyltransferase [Anaerorhabdus sp.]|uniref:methylated-DNA--[protein]-cysteine S-methyltransferase n=1 Tax=Anaerorhabdus sp. TaxID=1872524 RepID=UPI002FC9C2E2
MEYTTTYSSPLGLIILSSNGTELTGLWFEGQKYFARTLSLENEPRDLLIFSNAKKWLDDYFSGKQPASHLPLSLNGTPFQKEVWEILLQIPYGHTCAYGDIAKIIAAKHNQKSMSSQAVGGAVGRNPISIIVPCHRVLGANKNLTGYAGGVQRKQHLLVLEGIQFNQNKI